MSIALLFVLLCQAGPDEWVREVPNPLSGSAYVEDEPTRMVTRVLDAVTGEPIPGARLFAVEEVDIALPRLAAPIRFAVADANGWAGFPLQPWQGTWFYVTAPGYGPFADMDSVGHTTELTPGVDLEVLVTNPLGKPVADAHIGYYLGCGHTPDSRHVRTDERGRAVVPSIDLRHGYLFPIGQGIAAGDWQLMGAAQPGQPFRIVAPPGCTVEGRILDEAGQPLAGAFVGNDTWNHGPWTRTDEEGSFRLVGIGPRDTVTVYSNEEEPQWVHEFQAPPAGVRCRIRLGTAEPESTLAIRFLAEDREDWPDRNLPLYAYRKADGLLVHGQVFSVGEAEIDLPAGEFELVVGSEVGPYKRIRRAITMPDAAGGVMELTLELLPELRIDSSNLADGWEVILATANEEREITHLLEEGAIHAPRDVEAALRLESRYYCVAGPIIPVPKLGDEVRLPSVPLRETPGLPRSSEFRDVTVLTHEGDPVTGATVHCKDACSFAAGWTDEKGAAGVGYEGAVARVSLGDGWAVLKKPLQGEGPWTLRLGPSTLEIAVRGADHWYCCAPDGEYYELGEDLLILRGLAAGAHEFLVAPASGQAKQCRVVLEPGEHRRVTLRLED